MTGWKITHLTLNGFNGGSMGCFYDNDDSVVAAAVQRVEDETGLRPIIAVVNQAIRLKGDNLPGIILYLAAFYEHCAYVNEGSFRFPEERSRLFLAEARVYHDWLRNNAPELLGLKPEAVTDANKS